MTKSTALAKRAVASLVVAESTDELIEKLVEEHGFEERAILAIGDDRNPIPDGVYIERRPHGFAIWVPPDPARSVGNTGMLPPTVVVEALPHPRGHQLTLRRKMSRSNKVALIGAGIYSVSTMVIASLATMRLWEVLLLIGFPVLILFTLLAWQSHIASGRSQHAWQALTAALGPLALTGETSEDPYRGIEESSS